MKRSISAVLLIVSALWINVYALSQSAKPVIGATSTVFVDDANIGLLARVDSGAKICSIHAEDIRVKNAAARKEDDIGKLVTFTIANKRGKKRELTAPIINVSKVKTSEGSEVRYVVSLTLHTNGVEKLVHVNLNNRERMKYAMLIGSNFLKGMLIDVEQ
ncbi:MAG: RimK/LysX family protein [Sulfurimonadaceae bacterium]|nr:RimK/LysX family protein [Sulfurimonadaceae bacterium]